MVKVKKNKSNVNTNKDRARVNVLESKLFDKEKELLSNMSQIFDY